MFNNRNCKYKHTNTLTHTHIYIHTLTQTRIHTNTKFNTRKCKYLFFLHFQWKISSQTFSSFLPYTHLFKHTNTDIHTQTHIHKHTNKGQDENKSWFLVQFLRIQLGGAIKFVFSKPQGSYC